ncbi:MAG: hypothetical protein VX438_02985 [Planctomycetota bacterium]|nr:hypothetical protein [Planctomycetota bacterium]
MFQFLQLKNSSPVSFLFCLGLVFSSCLASSAAKAQGTSLTEKKTEFKLAKRHWIELSRSDTRVIIVDNAAVDVPQLPKHRAGYSGVACLTHKQQDRNIFVPGIAGLNFEHIHDGSTRRLVEKFEPRKFPMELRVINDYTVELYQPPTKNWKLESCGRYELLEDGTIEYTFECIPRGANFRDKFIGLFWASYIHQPEDKAIFFKARPVGSRQPPGWIKAVTPKHGVESTHRPVGVRGLPKIDVDFPLTLVNHPSGYEHCESWYYGVCRKMALVQMFRPQDRVWMAQSPSGGGQGNPAWDFQWFVDQPQVGQLYRLVMRMAYFPYSGPSQVAGRVQQHLAALGELKR